MVQSHYNGWYILYIMLLAYSHVKLRSCKSATIDTVIEMQLHGYLLALCVKSRIV